MAQRLIFLVPVTFPLFIFDTFCYSQPPPPKSNSQPPEPPRLAPEGRMKCLGKCE